jgi:hypothetical protein
MTDKPAAIQRPLEIINSSTAIPGIVAKDFLTMNAPASSDPESTRERELLLLLDHVD